MQKIDRKLISSLSTFEPTPTVTTTTTAFDNISCLVLCDISFLLFFVVAVGVVVVVVVVAVVAWL